MPKRGPSKTSMYKVYIQHTYKNEMKNKFVHSYLQILYVCNVW